MGYSRRVSLVLGGFSFVMLVWNLFTPLNEDHLVNIVEMLMLTLLFGVAFFVPLSISKVAQVVVVFGAAMVAAYTGDMQPAGALGTVAIVLGYTYGKFQSLPVWGLSVGAGLQVVNVTVAAVRRGLPYPVAVGHGIVWTLLPLVGVWLVWGALREFAEKMLAQNRELLEINKTLVDGGEDAPY